MFCLWWIDVKLGGCADTVIALQVLDRLEMSKCSILGLQKSEGC